MQSSDEGDTGSIFVLQGFADGAPNDDVWRLDLDSGIWYLEPILKPMPALVGSTVSVFSWHVAYLFGGSDFKSAFNDLYVLDTFERTFELMPVNGIRPQPRFSHAAILFNLGDPSIDIKDYSLVIFGGATVNKTGSTINVRQAKRK